MQSRILMSSKLQRALFAPPQIQSAFRPSSSSLGGGGVADTSVHGGDTSFEDAMSQGVGTEAETEDNAVDSSNENDINIIIPTKEDHQYYIHPKTPPPNFSSSRIETPAVNNPADPHFQQKRSNTAAAAASTVEFSCAGLDGSPWPEDESDRREQRKMEEEDDKEYFEHHKASALSEIEIVDSRKPLTRVTDGTGGGYFGGEQVMTWRAEQLDTAEESLRRAAEMFRESAARGVPEWPPSRRLRELRGEDW